MGARARNDRGESGDQQLRDAAQALADAAGQLGQSFKAASSSAESGVTKGLLAAAEALAQASAWVEQRARPLSTREQLLVQAARLFAERGFAGVSLVDIAQAAGFTKGAVYTHFGSKEQVFLASVRSVVERLRDSDGAGEPETPLPERADVEPDLDAIATLGVEALLFGRRVPEHRAEVRELIAELIPALARAGEQAAAGQAATETGAEPNDERVLAREEIAFALQAMRALLAGIAER
ncbi:TetR/AcrR family transcriptional regulator [Leucobacter chromiireducens]|uniref:TetR family transcriptional regulator n=1 Tax=Leucobacter chromiireducens subsp. solipictus TaxID=398235 RepID=A0ABS1SHA7_9MICO|nr:TetR/AcrR family transcriptional regulator [Leucobacter chromiireducens]MBL3679943.1 TetR family transcriptional regulator [Leucobacter chromiireducens subsp. solipictus]